MHKAGTFVGSVVTFIDISQRKRAEQAVRESEEKYRELFENATYGIFRSNREGEFLEVNPALVAMLGYSSEAELMTRNLNSDIYENPSERTWTIEKCESSGHVDGVEVNWRRADGKIIAVRVSGKAIRGANGQTSSYEAIVEDITERRSLEEQLRQAQKMEAVGLLAGGISHDFNNHLSVIIGNADLLLENLQSGKLQHYAEEIKKATERAAQLIRQLLALSRKQVLQPALLDLNAVVGDVVKILRHLIGEDLQIVIEGEANLASIWADRGQVEQILMNLANNARDAMPNGGKFTLRTENAELGPDDVARYPYVRPGRYVHLSVSDTGMGMSEEVRTRVFEPFFTTKPLGKGTGLGLATVYVIVKQSGGYIWISSVPGEGATFDIYLPGVVEAAPPMAGGLEVQSEYPKGTETILVLEDEESLRAVTCECLSAGGYSVLQAGRGDHAIEVAQQYKEPIHLILSDVVLPDISGPSAVETVRALHPETKVLFVSGYAEVPVAQKLIKEGAILLQKPVSRSDLMRKVDEILHLRIPSAEGVLSQ
jgi:PAS domain S-box-containing protein